MPHLTAALGSSVLGLATTETILARFSRCTQWCRSQPSLALQQVPHQPGCPWILVATDLLLPATPLVTILLPHRGFNAGARELQGTSSRFSLVEIPFPLGQATSWAGSHQGRGCSAPSGHQRSPGGLPWQVPATISLLCLITQASAKPRIQRRRFEVCQANIREGWTWRFSFS